MTTERPTFHFTPPQNFMNDPNGLVYWRGEYHLFYQHNPFGDTWGHMSWGHAVSRDGLQWQHLPIALYEADDTMIFSGSAVVDVDNAAGFAAEGQTALVAIYTGHGKGLQTQNLAYSLDDGRTWTKYADNPVLDVGSPDFRDPKVIWHALTARWVMSVVMAAEHQVRFYTSENLKDWTLRSAVGPLGLDQFIWECPDLLELPVEGENESVWLLKVDHGGAQYLVGDFDGEQFVAQAEVDGGAPRFRAVDAGPDFYASQSWSNLPDGEHWVIAWMANWRYANLMPTTPWRGSMTLPREWRLRRAAGGLRLVQSPIDAIRAWRTPLHGLPLEARQHEVLLEWLPGATGMTGLQVGAGTPREVSLGYDAQRAEFFLERQIEDEQPIAEHCNARFSAPIDPDQDGVVRLRILIDVGSIEIFGSAGELALTALIFNRAGERAVTLLRADDASVPLVTCYALNMP